MDGLQGANPAMRAGANPVASKGTKVDVRLRAHDLIGMDGVAPNNFAVLFHRTNGKSDWAELGRSETMRMEGNPEYRRIFSFEYHFELYQEIRIVVFERCTNSENLTQQALIGVADCTLGKIVSARGASLEMSLVNMSRGGVNVGRISVSAEEVISAKINITMQVSMTNLMSDEVRVAQEAYLNKLKAQLAKPGNAPSLQRRGAAAIMGAFRKHEKVPAVLPAHMMNQVQQEEDSRVEVRAQVHEIETAPPPFVPYLAIFRAPESAMAMHDIHSPSVPWEEVYRSVDIRDYRDLVEGVRMEEFTVSQYDLNGGNDGRLLKIAVVQSNSGQAGAIVGEMVTTLSALKRTAQNNANATLSLQPVGRLAIHKYEEHVEPSFVEYVRGGWCDFGLVCAIDFTSSNGDPKVPGTRHYNPANTPVPIPPNEYEAAMMAVGNMLASYSSDSRIPAYGFGANLAPSFNVSHCFQVTENHGEPFCDGVDGLVRAYKSTLNRIQLYGPTIFSEVLRTVGTIVSRRTEAALHAGNKSLAYTVLLILTDGVISDYDATVAELIKLSVLPLSVVIIGVGSEDFGKMHALDASRGPLRRGTEIAAREFVQFVPFSAFQGDLSVLAERVLGGIPDQVMSYITDVRGKTAPTR